VKQELSIELLCKEAGLFAGTESAHAEPTIYGVTDGKAIGTYLEHKFQACLREKYRYEEGSSARGIDFPKLGVDIKAASIKQPQSSCPFKNARQKIFGLGYSLLLFVHEKVDNPQTRTGKLNILHSIFIEAKKNGRLPNHEGNSQYHQKQWK